MQQFEAAVRGEDLEAIRRLHADHSEVREGINAPVFDFDAPAIVWAAGTLNEELIRLLVELGADIDARSAWENGPYSALHHASGGAGPIREGMASTLIELGATIDLHSAAGLGRLDLVAEILDAEPDRLAEPGPDGATPLHMAGNPEMAEFLLERGAPIDQPCVDHRSTPAMWAVAGRRDVSAFLVKRGARPDLWMAAAINDLNLARRLIEADPEAINVRPGGPELAGGNIYIWHLDFASSPLEVARRDGSEAMYQLLLAAAPPGLKMLEAALADDLTELTRLADTHPPGDLPDPWVREVLCQSAAVARILLDRGANPDALNSSGQAAMHHAAWESDLELLGVLLDAGANGVLRDREHNGSPWGWAEFCGQAEAQEFLEARGCLDGFDAIAVGRVDVVQAWLAKHPDQLTGGAGISPLRTAALNGQAEIVALLLKAGADPAARSQANGLSALDLAEAHGHDEIAAMLRAALG